MVALFCVKWHHGRHPKSNDNTNNNNHQICIAQVCRMPSEALDGQLQSCYAARAQGLNVWRKRNVFRLRLKSVTLYQKSDSVNRCLFTWRTIPPNFIPIQSEMMKPYALFEEGHHSPPTAALCGPILNQFLIDAVPKRHKMFTVATLIIYFRWTALLY